MRNPLRFARFVLRFVLRFAAARVGGRCAGAVALGAFGVCAAIAGCLDGPGGPAGPGGEDGATARIAASWDPLACGEPHRIALELTDDEGRRISSSAPCASGGLSLAAPHRGVYAGRIYSWVLGQPIRSIMQVEITVDEAVVRWKVATPQ